MEKENVLQRKGRSRVRQRRRRLAIIFAAAAWLVLMIALAYGMGLFGADDEMAAGTGGNRINSTAITPSKIDYAHPVGLITEVRGLEGNQLGPFEYVYLGQRIPLGMNASVSLVYFESCREEIIRGADVVVGVEGSDVGPHGSKQGRAVTCRPARMMVPVNLAAPGQDAYDSPFDRRSWNEVTIKSARPVFILPEKITDKKFSVEVSDEDSAESGQVWAGEMTSHFLAYPADAPTLLFGKPYSVQALDESGKTYRAVFSIEPESGASQSILNDFIVMSGTEEEAP